jgi:hypothetical protein
MVSNTTAKTFSNLSPSADLFPKFDLTVSNKGTLNGRFAVRSNNLVFAVGEEWKKQRRVSDNM